MYEPHTLLSFGGALYDQEQWTCGLRMKKGTRAFGIGPGGGTWEQALTDVVADLRTFFASSLFNTSTKIDWVKINDIDEQGHYQDKSTTHVRLLSGTSGANAQIKGTSTVLVAPQLSLAVSLLTDRDRGVGSRGRIFLPCPVVCATSIGSDGRLVENAVAATSPLAASFKTLLNNLNNWPGPDASDTEVAVATQGGRSDPQPANVKVTAFRIGRVIDTMRSRRNALSEGTHAKLAL
jgi:hypothetical protein